MRLTSSATLRPSPFSSRSMTEEYPMSFTAMSSNSFRDKISILAFWVTPPCMSSRLKYQLSWVAIMVATVVLCVTM